MLIITGGGVAGVATFLTDIQLASPLLVAVDQLDPV